MRVAVALVIAALAAAGCGSGAPVTMTPPPPTTWSLVLEGALIVDASNNAAPDLFVIATVDSNAIRSLQVTATPDSSPGNGAGFDAVWDMPLLTADETSLASGIDLQVFEDFGDGAQAIGRQVYRPASKDFGAGVIDLGAFPTNAAATAAVESVTISITPN